MGIITTYVCDVSGKQDRPGNFVRITIKCDKVAYTSPFETVNTTERFIHIDVARKLNLISEKGVVPQPEPTLESKLVILLKEYVDTIAYESAENALSNKN